MARIRSIHPGLFTDEAFMGLTVNARLLFIGIWTEAFDDGVFDWKPLTLKARIFPVDDVVVSELLAELVAHQCLRREELDGRIVGLVRNFQRFQRPKKPNSSGLLRAEWRTYVGCNGHGAVPVESRLPTGTEKPPQREEGGGKREEEGSLRSPRAAPEIVSGRTAELDALERELRAAAGLENDPSPGLLDLSPIVALAEKGYSLSGDILPKLREAKARGKKGRTWAYYVQSIVERKQANGAIPAKPESTAEKVAWVPAQDPRFGQLTQRYAAERGKPVTPHRSRLEAELGFHFPAAWAQAASAPLDGKAVR